MISRNIEISLFFGLATFLSLCATPCLGHTEATTDISAGPNEKTDLKIVEQLKEWIGNAMDQVPPSLVGKVLKSGVSPRCSLGLLKLLRGIRNLEPWALRLLDASAKYPTGALQGSRADLGAFDECVETVIRDESGHERVRGQYCNLLVYPGNASDLHSLIISATEFTHPRVRKFGKALPEERVPIAILGLCLVDDCNKDELQALLEAVAPPSVDLRISDCVTAVWPGFTKGQIIIISFLGALVLCITLATVVDIFSSQEDTKRTDRSVLLSVLMSFSAASNTRALLQVTREKGSDSYSLRFLHGIRFISIAWVVLGHCYAPPPDVWCAFFDRAATHSLFIEDDIKNVKKKNLLVPRVVDEAKDARLFNYVVHSDRWQTMVLTAAFLSVDSFLFLSGYLLVLGVNKQKRSGVIVFLFAVVRRLVRTMVPLFFMMMCLKLLPLIAAGPGAKTLFDKIDYEFQTQWLVLLLQVQNYAFTPELTTHVFTHLWYLSADFQFFLVALPILMLLKNRPKAAVGVFAVLSLVGCSIATWQVAGNKKTPFMVVVNESALTGLETLYYYYFYPFYHAVCYFTGCITFYLVSWFKTRKISTPFQVAAWCVAIACGLCCTFVKTLWYRSSNPTTEFGKLSVAFFDRIMWSIFLSWITFACATGRGGFANRFLSWSPFTALSRLAYAVYLLHLPFIHLYLSTSRERMFLSNFFVVSFFFAALVWSFIFAYMLFICCEAPTGRLDKLLFEARRKQTQKCIEGEASNTDGAETSLGVCTNQKRKVRFCCGL